MYLTIPQTYQNFYAAQQSRTQMYRAVAAIAKKQHVNKCILYNWANRYGIVLHNIETLETFLQPSSFSPLIEDLHLDKFDKMKALLPIKPNTNYLLKK